MKKYQVVSYDQASNLFPELRLGYESNILQLKKKNKSQMDIQSESEDQSSPRRNDEPPRDQEELGDEWFFDAQLLPKPLLTIPSPSRSDEVEDQEGSVVKRDESSFEFRNRSEHVLMIRPADEDLDTMKEIETMEGAEEQDLLPVKLKDKTIILPNRIYQFLKDVNIVFTTHFHYDDYHQDDYYTKFYFITDHCEVLDLEITKKKKNFEITMSYISQKTYVIDFVKDDPSTFQTIRSQKEFGAINSRSTRKSKIPHESYLRYFCKVFEKQICWID
jgi:hypothetical protein